MNISPLDVRNQIFRKKLRGFDPDEVKHFLEAVADCMEDMLKEKENLEKEVAILGEKTRSFAEMEDVLRDTMVTAQRVSDEARVNAQKAAENILREAEMEARARVTDIKRQVDDLTKVREDTKAQTMAFIAKLRSLLEGHLSFLGTVESEVRSEKTAETSGAGVYEDAGAKSV